MTIDKRKWFPEIFYEEDNDGIAGNLPFIQVPEDKEMPGMLFVFASKETGESEPGLDGEPVPIIELDLHQYANMNYIKEGLDAETYDKVRLVLGLEPMVEAAEKGTKITEKIRQNVQS